MDDSRLTELAHHLSTLAGMKMEAIAPLALVLPRGKDKRTEVALQLCDNARSISLLLEAAAYLLTRADELRSRNGVD
jgi:hypothetical protein